MGEVRCPFDTFEDGCHWKGDVDEAHSAYYGLHHECPECGAYISMGVRIEGCAECVKLPPKRESRPTVGALPMGVGKQPLRPMFNAPATDYFDGFTRAVFAAMPRVERGQLYQMMTRAQRARVFGKASPED